jgi:hypothetical protein
MEHENFFTKIKTVGARGKNTKPNARTNLQG